VLVAAVEKANVHDVPGARLALGVMVAVLPFVDQAVLAPGQVPPAAVKASAVVVWFMASLKVTLIGVVTATLVALFAGVVLTTVGGVALAAVVNVHE
jgi:hypothetical protein